MSKVVLVVLVATALAAVVPGVGRTQECKEGEMVTVTAKIVSAEAAFQFAWIDVSDATPCPAEVIIASSKVLARHCVEGATITATGSVKWSVDQTTGARHMAVAATAVECR